VRLAWLFRGSLVVLTFAMALASFRSGVGVTQRPDLSHADLLTHTYYAIGLFVLGGMDLGLPSGGPVAARALLWLAYFMAPVITTSAVIEGAVRLFNPQWIQRRGLRDHVVIVGIGRLGMLFLEALREHHPNVRVLIVDQDGGRANVQQARSRFGARFLIGDVRTHGTLESMMLARARGVVLLTDDDLVNLEAAWRIAERAPSLRVIAHVADIGLRRTVGRVEDAISDRIQVFNGHHIAAERLYEEHLEPHFAHTTEKDVVVLAGFGRFGQTILEYLQREARGHVQRAVVVDTAADRRVRLFRAQVPGFDRCELVTVQGDLEDPDTWEKVEKATTGADVEPVYVVGTDDDQINLRTAIALRSLHADVRIFVRCVYESTFTSQLARQLHFEVLAVESMLRQALAARAALWFSPERR
jgi:voltage-gated potassium channel Kch